jgi:hypothetical protein
LYRYKAEAEAARATTAKAANTFFAKEEAAAEGGTPHDESGKAAESTSTPDYSEGFADRLRKMLAAPAESLQLAIQR